MFTFPTHWLSSFFKIRTNKQVDLVHAHFHATALERLIFVNITLVSTHSSTFSSLSEGEGEKGTLSFLNGASPPFLGNLAYHLPARRRAAWRGERKSARPPSRDAATRPRSLNGLHLLHSFSRTNLVFFGVTACRCLLKVTSEKMK